MKKLLLPRGLDKGLLQIHLWCPDNLPMLWGGTEMKRNNKAIFKFNMVYLFISPSLLVVDKHLD